jgi:hypothetical protein
MLPPGDVCWFKSMDVRELILDYNIVFLFNHVSVREEEAVHKSQG